MKQQIRRFYVCVLCLVIFLGLCATANAQENAARDISKETTISAKGLGDLHLLTNGKDRDYCVSNQNCQLVLEAAEPIGSLYILFHDHYGPYTITDNATGNTYAAGENWFLHEYVDVASALGDQVTSLTISFENGGVYINELYIFSHGQVPDFVQRWEAPLDGNADILLFAAHSDDDQLYFAGLFPQYARELGYRVQVAYMTDHRKDTWVRSHEVLNGLWATGVTHYPVFGDFDDFRRDDKAETYQIYARKGVSKDDLLGYVVEQIRRFDPLVVVTHDFKGEYGHGMHQVYAELVSEAVEITADPQQFPQSAETYGTWDVQKTYVHAYAENPIELDYDTPLESFDGLTAFQVSQQLGFPSHKSQTGYASFTNWLYGRNGEITKATEIKLYPPYKFGLLRTTVGPDIEKNDFMENVISYGEQERLEAERLEQERLEAERLEQERLEAERLEKERLEAERLEAERLEKERLEAERLEAERLEAERLEAERKAKELRILLICGAALVVAALLVTAKLISQKNSKKR